MKMQDKVLNSFIQDLLTMDIEENSFINEIDLFSKFIGYVNPDYKYNGTYLKRFVDDFLLFIQKLRKRNEKYHEVWNALKNLGKEFELTIDGMFYARYPLQEDEKGYFYIAMNENFLEQKKIEIRINYRNTKNEYIFCKTYSEWEDEDKEEVKNICKEFVKFVDTKEKWEKESEVKGLYNK